MNLEKSKINEYASAFSKIYAYIYKTKYLSYDQADFKGLNFVIELLKKVRAGNVLSKIQLKAIYAFFYFFPVFTRQKYKVNPTILSGGVAFLLTALVEMIDSGSDQSLIDFRDDAVKTLLDLTINCNDSIAWGLEFDWFSFDLVPARTPIGYSSCMAADALLSYYKQTKDEEIEAVLKKATNFFFSELNLQPFRSNSAGLSYTKLDRTMVVNSNALIASYLFDVFLVIQNQDCLILGNKLLNFVLEMQNPNGSWFYAKDEFHQIDHYHTAMTIQALIRVYKSNNLDQPNQNKVLKAIINGIEYHLIKLFNRYRPMITPNSEFPLSTILVMEDVVTFNLLNDNKTDISPDLLERVNQQWIHLIDYAIRKLQNPDGSFTAIYYPFYNNRFSMLRWSNAPMLRALNLTLKRFANYQC